MENCSVIDIFCGAGGLTHGFVEEGFNVVAGLDSDGACRYPYEHNNGAKFIHKKLEDASLHEISSLYPSGHTKILVGCAPCQPYSKAPRENRSKVAKWSLLDSFAKLVEHISPEVVSMENVPELKSFNKGSVYNGFVKRLESAGYIVSSSVVFCPDYGIPQKRRRLVLFASKRGQVDLITKTHSKDEYISVAQVISQLPPIGAGEVCSSDPLHRAPNLSDINLKRIRQSLPGGTWRDWESNLIVACHTKKSGKSYDSVYGRMTWRDPSPTITTQFIGYGNGRFGHPEQDRALSLREGALLQTFPREYEFFDPEQKWFMEGVARLIGNAVPVVLGRVIAKSIKIHLEKYSDSRTEF